MTTSGQPLGDACSVSFAVGTQFCGFHDVRPMYMETCCVPITPIVGCDVKNALGTSVYCIGRTFPACSKKKKNITQNL
jgi:hypothetical protein